MIKFFIRKYSIKVPTAEPPAGDGSGPFPVGGGMIPFSIFVVTGYPVMRVYTKLPIQ
jgi:hypothetical protein